MQPREKIALDVLPAYDGPCRLLAWRHDARDGMTVDLSLGHPGIAGAHPFRGMPAGREIGQRLRIEVAFPATEGADRGVGIHSGEALLLRWSENDRSGMMVRLLLDDGPDGEQGRHPFFGLAVGRGRGEPLDLVGYAVSDDEKVVPVTRVRGRTPFHLMTEVAQSNVLSREPRFQEFLSGNLERFVPDATTRESLKGMDTERPKDVADATVRAALGVASRSVMNQSGEAASVARAKWREILGAYEDEMWGNRVWSREARRSA